MNLSRFHGERAPMIRLILAALGFDRRRSTVPYTGPERRRVTLCGEAQCRQPVHQR